MSVLIKLCILVALSLTDCLLLLFEFLLPFDQSQQLFDVLHCQLNNQNTTQTGHSTLNLLHCNKLFPNQIVISVIINKGVLKKGPLENKRLDKRLILQSVDTTVS